MQFNLPDQQHDETVGKEEVEEESTVYSKLIAHSVVHYYVRKFRRIILSLILVQEIIPPSLPR